jgi:hypothetical protein
VRTDDAHDTGTNNAKENAIEKAFSRIVKPRTWQECFCYRFAVILAGFEQPNLLDVGGRQCQTKSHLISS